MTRKFLSRAASESVYTIGTMKSTKLRNVVLIAISFGPALLASLPMACGGGNENLPPPPPPPAAPPTPSSEAPAPSTPPSASATSEAPPPPPAQPVQLTMGSASPDPPAPLPTVRILAPAKDAVLSAATAGDTVIKLDVKNWKTAKGDAHVHLILDDRPYHPVFDPKTDVVKLSDLSGGNPLSDGQHILVAFPSRANHESVKTKGAMAIVPFWVGKKGEKLQDPTKPMLIASRPKGEYKGDMANHVLVDFQLANATLAPGKDHVHIVVTGPGTPDGGIAADATQFGPPFYLDNLQNGSYTIKLELLGADEKPLAGSWNEATRQITVAH